MTPSRSLAPTIYLVAFISAGVLMGFEMLASHYIFVVMLAACATLLFMIPAQQPTEI